MKKSKRIDRIKTLIDRIDNGRTVTRTSLSRVLGETGLRKLDREWIVELNSRNYKPKEIVEYSSRIRKGLIHYALGDKKSLRGESYKSKKSFDKAESILEDAVEYLRDVVGSDCGLRMWIDRDIGIGSGVELCPEGISRPIWSNTNYRNKCGLPKNTKKDLMRELFGSRIL